jgi:hypothetical protein
MGSPALSAAQPTASPDGYRFTPPKLRVRESRSPASDAEGGPLLSNFCLFLATALGNKSVRFYQLCARKALGNRRSNSFLTTA